MKLSALLVLGFAALCQLQAGTIQGTLTISALGATLSPNGSTVNTATVIDPTVFSSSQVLAGTSTGNFTLIPNLTIGSGGVVDLANLSTYSIVFASYGSFTATSGTITRNSGGFLDLVYVGTFTPATIMTNAGVTAGSASMRLSINQNGQSVSYGGTLSAPAAAIPEPSTYGLTATALTGLFLLARRRRN